MIKLSTKEEKEKARKLHDIDIDEITLCASAANRKQFFITKASQPVIDAVNAFLGDDVEKQDISIEDFVAAVKEIMLYKEDMPDKMKDSFDTLLKYVAQTGMLEAKEETEEKVKKDDDDDWPSVYAPTMTEELVEEEEELEKSEEEEFDEMDPIVGPLQRIERALTEQNTKEQIDPWPSLTPAALGVKVIEKAQPVKVKKVDPNEKKKGQSKQIRNAGDEKGNVKKSDSEEDLYPSLPDGLFERP